MPNIKDVLSAALSGLIAAKIPKIRPEVTKKLEQLIEQEPSETPLDWNGYIARIADYLSGLKDGFGYNKRNFDSMYYQKGANDGAQFRSQWQGGENASFNIYGQLVFSLQILQNEILNAKAKKNTEAAGSEIEQTRASKAAINDPIEYLSQKIGEDSAESGGRRSAYGLSVLIQEYGSFLYQHLTGRRIAATEASASNPASIVDAHIEQGLTDILQGRSEEGIVYEFTSAFMTILEHRTRLRESKYTKLFRALGLINFGRNAGALRSAYLEFKGDRPIASQAYPRLFPKP